MNWSACFSCLSASSTCLTTLCAGKLVVGQSQACIALDGIGPNRNGFVPAAKLPERFAFFLARENQIVSFRQSFIQTGSRLVVTPQTIQNRAAIIKTQSFACSFLMSCGLAERLYGLFRVAKRYSNQASFGSASLFTNSPVSKQPENVLFLARMFSRSAGAEPASGIDLRQGQLVGQLDLLKCAVAEELVIAHPAAVRVQANPDTGEDCKCPARFSNFA